ncbi:MAG: sigma factor-like helix-turn-helix DNA-binding protein [Methyloceanibacter sp.]
MRTYAASGHSIKETAAEFGLAYATVFVRAKRAGIKFKRPRSTLAKVSDPSREEMLGLYRNGATLQQIGDRFGVTRERVRQILKRLYGINALHGGARLIARPKAISNAARKDAKYLAKYGCSYAQVKELLEMGRTSGVKRDRTPIGAFRVQRRNARRDGCEWKLTLWEWWTIWQRSGHWNERGRGKGYWLARRDKSGPFSVDNVFTASGADSWSEIPEGFHRKSKGTPG